MTLSKPEEPYKRPIDSIKVFNKLNAQLSNNVEIYQFIGCRYGEDLSDVAKNYYKDSTVLIPSEVPSEGSCVICGVFENCTILTTSETLYFHNSDLTNVNIVFIINEDQYDIVDNNGENIFTDYGDVDDNEGVLDLHYCKFSDVTVIRYFPNKVPKEYAALHEKYYYLNQFSMFYNINITDSKGICPTFIYLTPERNLTDEFITVSTHLANMIGYDNISDDSIYYTGVETGSELEKMLDDFVDKCSRIE